MTGATTPFAYDKMLAEFVYEDYQEELKALAFTEDHTEEIGTTKMPPNNTIMLDSLVFNRGPLVVNAEQRKLYQRVWTATYLWLSKFNPNETFSVKI